MEILQAGQTLGPYRIINQVGQGGMATVYKAYHAAMDRYVALKVLPRQLAEKPEFMERFRQEARVVANLEHPRILPVYDYGESEGIVYLVMRYLEAGTLKERLATAPLTANDIDRFFSQLAEALDYAHRKGVIHRDLKPANALLDAQGQVFLTDFGIAKLLESDSRFTTTGATIGTPAYMSPEQAQGSLVDQRTDIYALGVILYEMVTGQVPFEADTPLAVILKHISAPLPLPSAIKPDIAPEVERVLLKALAKDPADRYASAAEFLAAWRQCFGQAPTFRAPLPEQPAQLTVASNAAGSANTAPTVSQTAPSLPTPRKVPVWAWVVGIGILVVGAAALLDKFTASAPVTPPPVPTASPTPMSMLLPPTETAVVVVLPTVEPTPAGPWTQWTAANYLYGVQPYNDSLLAWGQGGILQWHRASGVLTRQYTPARDGLPFSEVFALLADEKSGEWWVATQEGLGRWREGEWTLYNEDDGLDSSVVTALARLPQGLLVGTKYSEKAGGGLLLFDGKVWQAVPDFPSAPENPTALSANITTVLVVPGAGNENQWWVGTEQGLGFYDGAAWTQFTTAQGLPGNYIHALTWINDELWVGTDGGAAMLADGKFTAVANGPQTQVFGITRDARGRLWFGTDMGVWRFDSATADWERFTPDRGNLPVNLVLGGVATAEGDLFWATEAGLLRFADSGFQVWAMPNQPAQANIAGILPSRDGGLWFFGTGPVQRYDLASGTWTVDTLPCTYCAPLGFDAEEQLWLNTYEDGVWKTTEAGVLHLTAREGLPANTITALSVDDEGHVWLGTEAGAVVWDGEALSAFYNSETVGLPFARVNALLNDDQGSMWLGGALGLSRYDMEDETWEYFTAGAPFSDDLEAVTALAADKGTLWVGTSNAGLYRYLDGAWKHWETPHIRALTVDDQGRLWLAFYNSGAAMFDGADWQYFGMPEGLPHYNVAAIYAAPNGAIWFGTENGIARYQP